jgi:outer membrane protein OmpA-like peptidoglycan-associated protein
MNLKFAAVSVMALALFIGPVMAEDPPPADQPAAAEQPAVEQPVAEQPAEATAPAAIPDAVMALVNDRRSSQELSDDELKNRAKQARRAIKTPDLPEDIKGQLQAMMDADRAELETRVAAQKPVEKSVEEAAPAPKVEEPVQQAEPEVAPAEKKKKPKVEEPVQQAEPEAAPAPAPVAEIPADVTELLNDTRTLEELTDKELAVRARNARAQSRNAALPEDVRQKLTAVSKEARQAMVARQQQTEEKKKTEEPVVAQPEAAPKVEEPVVAQPEPPASKKDEPVVAQPEPAPVITEPPPETKAVEPVAPPAPPPVVDKADVKELDGNAGDPAAEKKARAYLDDATPADSLTDEALRARLDGIRDLMAENELSIKTERALRQKLGTERDVLRARVAKVKAEEEAKAAAAKAAEEKKKAEADAAAGKTPEPKKDKKPNINIIITADTPLLDILRDRRDAQDIDESELRYRIRARRDFEASDQFREYNDGQRQQWRETTRRDRDFLRNRLEEDRNIRRVELERPSNIRRIVIDDSQRYKEDGYPDEVFAAEVDDTELERVLLAPPRKKITRKISVNEIVRQPEARKAMTRIDVDTIRFGFNEAFVREEEVDSLDKIASVIEQVLKKYPREVFLIEGHTDAVGSDAYNDKLSKARAEAVKKALSTYYVIPQKNLQTVGLGERYLKIPTAEAEQENRRVSISRATAVIGEAAE